MYIRDPALQVYCAAWTIEAALVAHFVARPHQDSLLFNLEVRGYCRPSPFALSTAAYLGWFPLGKSPCTASALGQSLAHSFYGTSALLP